MKKLLVLGCILSILLTGMMVIGCGGEGGGGGGDNSAEAAAKSFFSAYENNDADTTWDLLSAGSKEFVKKADWDSFLEESDPVKFTVGKVTEDGDKATAKVTADTGTESSEEDVPLVKEGGEWKVNMAGVNTED